MVFFLRSKIHLAAASFVLAAVIFIIHQMFSNVGEPNTTGTASLQMSSFGGQMELSNGEQRNEAMSSTLSQKFEGQKLVHLDLKGAPPLVPYLQKLFPLLKRLGATGLLIEYEDMFPYGGSLDNIPAYNAYNASQIQSILRSAKDNDLKVIPLIQTFGHMEFVIKLEDYKDLREVDAFPQAVCPTNHRTLSTLYQMIDQIIGYHPRSTYIHIGGDEVQHIGRCERCTRLMAERSWTKEQLFLSHIRNVTQYIKDNHPNVRPIMWDDEFRYISPALIEEFQVAKLVDIMVWKYTPKVEEYITDELLEKYSQLFEGIWIASAFKGATGASSIVTDVNYHLENHKSWMELLTRWKGRLNVKGIALTGWQRYDHFGVLCELLPVAIPSLTICLRYLEGQSVDDNTMSRMLECDFPFAWNPSHLSSLRSATACTYPGSTLYQLVNSLYVTLNDINHHNRDVAKGWFTWHHTIHNFSSPLHVEESTSKLDFYKVHLQFLEDRLRTELMSVYDSHTAEEWISTFLLPTSLRLTAAAEARDRLLGQRTWPRRPLDRIISDRQAINGICDGTGSLSCVLLGV